MISASLVKELRDKTGAGMMDCKRALTETNGDIDKAIDWLREKGISKAEKKADRIAAEGLADIVIESNNAYIYEVNSETDFVAKNEQFLQLLKTLGEIAINVQANDEQDVLNGTLNGQTGQEYVINATATIGEKISLRRLTKVTKNDDEVFGIYKHMGGKIAVLSILTGKDAELAKDICMHIAAMKPRFLDHTQVPADVIEHEKHILTQEALNEGKPMAIVEKMVIGRVNKYLKEICLVDQPFVKNQDVTVGQHVKNNGSSIRSFIRYEVAEGMQKRVDNFAEEVAAQVEAAQKK
ncbi:MAG: translation elongation factor Ts [Bacilli bacterium]|jgi:elongation factor Ts|nr:translation elongation factor Ts [Bacilli bacterium]HHU23665.1 elongation factor Ts [Acholeplasmataceae bacterium]